MKDNTKKTEIIFGIDYGSKLTGNTVIALFNGEEILFLDVDKGVDADKFILNAAEHFTPSLVFLDAPLSLPGVYTQKNGCINYHFRHADLEARAMSPMFLGGLAARAMELKGKLEKMEITVKETYPRIVANHYKLKNRGYKTHQMALKDCREFVGNSFKDTLKCNLKDIKTWHHLDALLALIAALNYTQGQGNVFGQVEEGQIFA